MTDEMILKKAIERAVKGGYNPIDDMGKVHNFEIYRADGHWKGIWIRFQTKVGDGGQIDLTRMIFDHDFARAFFGEPKDFEDCYNAKNCDIRKSCEECREGQEGWKFNLSKMVLQEQPLKYLEKFLKEI